MASVAILKEMVQQLSSSSIAVLKEVEQQLSSLTQVVWNLHGHIHGNEDVQQARRTPEDIQHGEGCVLGSDFLDIVMKFSVFWGETSFRIIS